MKLWQKNISSLKEVENFTVGNDRAMDMYLASFDVLGSLAHTKMLHWPAYKRGDAAAACSTERNLCKDKTGRI